MAAAPFVERSSGEQQRPERPWYLVGFRGMAGDPSIPEPPRLPEQLERAEIETLAHDDVYTETTLRDLDLSEQEANGVSFGKSP